MLLKARSGRSGSDDLHRAGLYPDDLRHPDSPRCRSRTSIPGSSNNGYVAAAYIVFFAIVLIYVAIMALRLTRVSAICAS